MDEYQTKHFWDMIEVNNEKFTFRDLKKVLDTLTEEQLNMEVRWAGDSRGGTMDSIWIVEEDQINPSGDGMEPVSAYDNDPDFDATDEPVVCKKGTVLLLEN
jgi:hypothetical protein